MTCHQTESGAHICTTTCIAIHRQIRRCPSCKTRRRFTVYDEGWYGHRAVCNHCGSAWSDGHRYGGGKKAHADRASKAREAWRHPFDNSAEYWADYMEARQ